MDVPNLQTQIARHSENQEHLETHIRAYARRRQRRQFIQRLAWSLAAIFGAVVFFLLFERTPLQSEIARWLCAIILYVGMSFSAFHLLRTLFFQPSSVDLAREIEAQLPDFRSTLVTAAEFLGLQATPPGTSEALLKLTVGEAASRLSESKTMPVLKRISSRYGWGTLLFFSMLLGSWYLLSPFEVRRGVTRLLNPFSDAPAFSPLALAVGPGNRIIAKGESLQIFAVPNQDLVREPLLTLFKEGDTEGTSTEMYPDETASRAKYVFTLTGLQESTDYQVSAEKFVSERFSVTVLPRPDIRELEVTLHHPAYLGLREQKLPAGTGECTVLNGTRIAIAARATQRLASGVILFEPPASHTLDLKGESLKTEITPATDTRFSLWIENEHGLANDNPPKFQISVTEDASPTVTILKPAMDLPFPQSKRLDLKVTAKDDFGVVSVVLYYSIGDRQNWIPLNMKSDFSPKPEFDVDYPWLLDTLAIQPGVEIHYQVRAEDGMKPKPHIASTPTFKVSMPSMYDVYKGTDQAHQEVQEKLKDYMRDQQVRREALHKALEEVKHQGKLDYDSEKQIENAIQEGMESQKEAQEILEQFDQLKDRLENNPFSTPEGLEKMQKLHELLNDVLDDEAKKLMKQLQEALKDMKVDPKEAEKYEQAFKMDDYMKNLDRNIELLEQMRKDLKMNALGEALQDLKKRQEHVASETANLEKQMTESPLSAEEQKQLADLRQKLDDLQNAHRQQQQNLASEAAALEQKSQQQALSPEDKQKLQDLKERMEKAQKAFEEERKKAAEELARLENRENAGKKAKEDDAKLKDLRRQQEKIKDELEKLQKQAEELTQQKPPEGQQEHPAMEDIKNLRDKFKQEDFKKAMEQIDKSLGEKNLSEAQKNQQQMLKFLESLAKDGQKICQSCQGGGQQTQLDLSRFIRKALSVSQDQEYILRQLDGMPGQFMRGQRPNIEGRIDEASVLELLVKRQAQDLEEALEAFVKSSIGISPDVLLPLSGVRGLFAEIVKDLEDRGIDKATSNQREIIRRFNLLAMELMKAQDQSQNNSSSSNPMNAMQQFKQLTQRQLSLYQQGQKQQMSPADQKLMESLKQQAMQQRKIREQLEQVMREGKKQNQVLGRMDDVLQDMQDLETKILDPKLRREVAEKQKSIYERMLRAQKSIKNRDEEKEERKAEKARELIQESPNQPLPTAGSDSRDLSKDYLTDIREEFPKSYETEINDYYKSLNLYGNQEP